MAMKPRTTVKMAMTIATIGRLMKNSEIMGSVLSVEFVDFRQQPGTPLLSRGGDSKRQTQTLLLRWFGRRRGKGLRVDDHIRSDSLQAFGNDFFIRLHP